MAGGGINKAILIGNLGRDPEVRYLPNGNAVTNVRIATSESWKDRATGEPQERTEWHTVVFFGKLAEIVGQYCRKGSKIYVEGKLRTRKWQAPDGQDRYTTEVIVDINGTMQMLDSRGAAGATAVLGEAPPQGTAPPGLDDPADRYDMGSTQSSASGARAGGRGGSPDSQGAPSALLDGGEPFDDDIPF